MKKISWALLFLAATSLAFAQKKKPFTIALLPDTQNYSDKYPHIFKSQTSWVADKKNNITYVLQLGDITNNNTPEQWEVAREAFTLMDGKVPYMFVLGNHDIGTKGTSDIRNTELFNQYLPYSKYSRMAGFGGAFEDGKMDNVWYTFKAGGYKWLILGLEFGPRNAVLEWANEVVSKHPKHKVIIITHAYMYSDDKRISVRYNHKWTPQSYGIGKDTGPNQVNDGEDMWEKLVSIHKNIMFVFSGHVLNDGVGTLVSRGNHGNNVYQMLANFQTGVIGSKNGGNGFLRLVTISPQEKKVMIKTYSPYLDQFEQTPEHEFGFEDVVF